MVKIEKLTAGAKVTVVRNGEEVQVFEKQQLPLYELNSLKVHSGTVTYSVNEEEVVEVAAPVVQVESVEAKPAAKAAKK